MSGRSGRNDFTPTRKTLLTLYRRLIQRYGEQAWWPADTAFEVAVGAVLTQNAAWSNVERAIERLRERDWLSPEALLDADEAAVADAIRPSGYFNVKARRLRNLCRFLADAGGLEGLRGTETPGLRSDLLAVNGIGPETADDILLYALERPVFVIDSYTRRLLQRLGLARGDEAYDVLRDGFERALGPDTALFKQYHALIVIHAKHTCRKKPACAGCVLAGSCPVGKPGG
jgi:endonuclease-3 related protein